MTLTAIRPRIWRLAFLHFTLSLLLLAASPARAAAQSLGAGMGAAAPPASAAPAGVPPVQSATSSSAPLPSQSMLYPGEDFQLGPGDLISVHLFGAPDYVATVRIGIDGTVELPYIGTVQLGMVAPCTPGSAPPLDNAPRVLDSSSHLCGLTVRQAQRLVADKLRTGEFYRNPDITIQVLESLNGSVTISGEVRSVVPITGARRLIDILASAGGLPANASHTVRIVRPGLDQPIVINLGADYTHSAEAAMLVYPRDIIQISRAGVVYVLGAFKVQGAVQLDQAMPLTLIQLAALSGGLGYEGRYQDLRLIRTVGTDRKLVEVDIKKVLNGKAPDPVLEANDIVFLPTNQMKAALKSLGIGGVLGLVSLIYSFRSF